MSDPPRRPQLTLLGMPFLSPDRGLSAEVERLKGIPAPHVPEGVEAEPFPLTPYRDVHVYTPSHERPAERRTMLPPARKSLPTMVLKRPTAREPSRVALCMAAAICCYVIALAMLLTF